MSPPLKTLLIANRGEIAVRIIRAARELGIRTVAVFSEADKESLHVRMADEAVHVGPHQAAKSYLNVAADAEVSHRADLRLSHFISPGVQQACGSEGSQCGSWGRRHKAQKWLTSASAPTLEAVCGELRAVLGGAEQRLRVGVVITLADQFGRLDGFIHV